MLTISLTAEFIISLSEKNNTFEAFKKVLLENGAEFGVSTRKVLLSLMVPRTLWYQGESNCIAELWKYHARLV